MIENFFTKTFTVSRMVNVGSVGQDLQEVGDITGHLQNAAPELEAQLDIAYSKAYVLWTALDSDVEIGDTLVRGSDTYSVKALKTLDYGDNTHLELILQKDVG